MIGTLVRWADLWRHGGFQSLGWVGGDWDLSTSLAMTRNFECFNPSDGLGVIGTSDALWMSAGDQWFQSLGWVGGDWDRFSAAWPRPARRCFNPSDGLGVIRTISASSFPGNRRSFNPSDGLGVIRTAKGEIAHHKIESFNPSDGLGVIRTRWPDGWRYRRGWFQSLGWVGGDSVVCLCRVPGRQGAVSIPRMGWG